MKTGLKKLTEAVKRDCRKGQGCLLHFVVSFILMEIMCGVWGSWCWAALATFIIGLFKEIVVDKLVMKENVDTDDLWADIFGIVGALITMWLMFVMLQLIWK